MRLFAAIAEGMAALLPTSRKSRVGLQYETPNLSSNATVGSVQSAIRAAEGGDTRELFALYRDLTVGGSHIQAEFNKRKLAILAQPLAVLPADKSKPEDVKAAAAITQMVSDCENWNDGLTHLMDSCLWPVAMVEKIFRPVEAGEAAAALGLSYTLRRFEVVNPTLLCFRKPRSEVGGRKSEVGGRRSEVGGRRSEVGGRRSEVGARGSAEQWEQDVRLYPTDEEGRILWSYEQTYALERERHLVHRGHLLIGLRDCWGGPMRAIVFWWLLSVLGRDWFARAMERFGVPFPVGHTDAKDKAAIDFLNQAFSLATKIGGLVVDHETQVELKEVAISGLADAHEKFLSICNREISKVIVGQTLSAEAQSTGLGSSVGNLQSDVREDIRMFDQIKLGETLKQQLCAQFLRINGLRGTAKIVWGGLSDEDAKTFAELLELLKRAGWEPTDGAVPVVQERLGFEVQRVAQVGLQDYGTTGLRDHQGTAKGLRDNGTTGLRDHQGTTEGPQDDGTTKPKQTLAALSAVGATLHPSDRIAMARAKAMGEAYRGAMAPFRQIILSSSSREECLAKLSAAYVDWSPERLANELESALQLCAAAGAVETANQR